MDKGKRRRLLQALVKEVSFVDRPANLRTFILVKREGAMELAELLKQLLPENATLPVVEGLTEDKAEALKNALGTIHKYSKDFTDDLTAAIAGVVATLSFPKEDAVLAGINEKLDSMAGVSKAIEKALTDEAGTKTDDKSKVAGDEGDEGDEVVDQVTNALEKAIGNLTA